MIHICEVRQVDHAVLVGSHRIDIRCELESEMKKNQVARTACMLDEKFDSCRQSS